MPKYRVRTGRRWGPGRKYGPGDIVDLTEFQASGFLDLLEPVEENDPGEEANVTNQQAPGGGFNPYNATVDEVKEWLKTNPSKAQAASALQQERDGKNRTSAIEALESYIAGGGLKGDDDAD